MQMKRFGLFCFIDEFESMRTEVMSSITERDNNNFSDIISIIESAKQRAMKAVNSELINMYWEAGKCLSSLVAGSSFGDKVIDEVTAYIAENNPAIKGVNRRGLYRMKQFYEMYKDDEFVSTLLTQISSFRLHITASRQEIARRKIA